MSASLDLRFRFFVSLAALLALVAGVASAQITMKGKPITLAGEVPAVGEPAPGFTALDNDFQPVSLGDFAGHPVLISVVPSLETSVCSMQTRHFNEELAKLPAEVVVITISMDLPTAQKRFCGAEGITRMVVLSDSARREFGAAYGVLIPERGVLTRSVFVVDAAGVLRYAQLVPEVSHEPDYAAALAALRGAAGY
jgi:thiol peroxidase